EASVRRAKEIYESLVLRSPGNPEFRSLLSNSLNNLASYIEGRPERLDEAETLRRQVLEIRQALTKELPDNLNFRRLLGQALSRLGKIRRLRGHPEESRKLSEQAIALQKSALSKAPWNLAFQETLQSSYIELANAREDLG